MAEPYQRELTDKTSELNKRIDDVSIAVDYHWNVTKTLMSEYAEIQHELFLMRRHQKAHLLWLKILTGISVAMWIIMWVVMFILALV